MKAAAITPNGFMPEARGTNPVRCNTHGYQDNMKARMTNVANGCFFKVFDGGPPLDSENEWYCTPVFPGSITNFAAARN